LTTRRINAGYTQQGLADEVGLALFKIYCYETGRLIPSRASLKRIKKVLRWK